VVAPAESFTTGKAATLFVNFIAPPAPEKKEEPKRPPPPKLKPIEKPQPRQIVAETPVVAPTDYVAPPPPLPAPAPVIEAPPMPLPAGPWRYNPSNSSCKKTDRMEQRLDFAHCLTQADGVGRWLSVSSA
jgi:hypothetical protein